MQYSNIIPDFCVGCSCMCSYFLGNSKGECPCTNCIVKTMSCGEEIAMCDSWDSWARFASGVYARMRWIG